MCEQYKIAQYFKFSVLFTVIASVLTSLQGHVLEFVVEPSDTVVEAGQSAVLDCVVRAAHHQASVLIQWLDQDRSKLTFMADLYRSQLTNGSLYINSVIEEQRLTGTYQCMATLPNVGSIVSRTAKLSIASLSGFNEEPSDLTVYIGQRAHFACHVEGVPPPKIRWLKDERPLQLDDLRMVILPSGALEIDEVVESDQGSYRCNASGYSSYRLSNKAILYINGDQEQAAHVAPPSFIAQPRPGTYIEGQNVSLDCAANGNPTPTIRWLKDGYPIDMNDLDSRFSLVGTTSSLRITRIKEEDAGTYQCRAENREDSMDASALIDIQVPPRFLKQPQDKTEVPSKDVELECMVYGVPEPKVQWFKNGELVKYSEYYKPVNGYNLKIMGLMTTDSGIFQCLASNPAGNIQSAASLKVVAGTANPAGKKIIDGLPGPPQDLRAPIVKGRFVILSWKPPVDNAEDIQSYSVYYRQEGSDRERYQNTTRSKLEEINIGGLLPGRVYHFRVVPHSSSGVGVSSEILTVTTQSEEHVASAPQNFNVYATSPRSIHLNWQPPEVPNGLILHYTIYYMETSSSIEHNVETTEFSYDLQNLTPFTEYSVWVVAVNQNGAGAATEEKLVKTFSTIPSHPPTNITVEPSSTSVVIRWEPPPPETQNGVILGYKIKIKKMVKGKSSTYVTPPSDRHFVISDLEKGEEYQIRIWATNMNGTGPPSDWIDVSTFKNDVDESRVPDQPAQIRVRPASDKLYVMWLPPANQNIRVRHYILGWGKGIPDMYNQELEEKNRTFIIERLEPNSEYVLSLRASNQMGAGPPIYTTVRTQEEPPPEPNIALLPPMALKAQVVSSTSVVLYWTDPTLKHSQYVKDNRHYVVKYTDEKSRRTKFINVTDLNVMVNDLKPNTLYDFSVKLVKDRKESPWSMVVQNRTWELVLNVAPRELDVHFKDKESQLVELTWQPPKLNSGRVTGYVILYTYNKTLADPEWKVSAVKGDVHSAIMYDLKPFTIYYFKVQARNSRGYGPFSNVVMFKTGHSVATHASIQGQQLDSNNVFSSKTLLYTTIGGCILAVITIAVVIGFICCRRREVNTSPDRTKKGYQKSAQNVKPPDLWIHHDQMELKAMEKRHSTNDGASSSGAMTLPRSVGGNDYDTHDNLHTNSLDKRAYAQNSTNYGSDDKLRKSIKTKPINLPVDSKPPREPIVTPINSSAMSQSSSDSTPSSRPAYPRTQYSMPRAHVSLDSTGSHTQMGEGMYSSHALHNPYENNASTSYPNQPPAAAHIPPGSTYAPGMSVLAESHAGKRIQAQGHPLKSFTVPAPPPISAPGTPQPKHIVTVRPTTASPYKKPPSLSTSTTSTPPSRINTSNPPPHTAEEMQRLNPSHSTEELNQEMANLEGLMLTLNAITANEFEC